MFYSLQGEAVKDGNCPSTTTGSTFQLAARIDRRLPD